MDEIFFGPDFLSDEAEVAQLSLKEGELREVSVLFADIKGFTSISNLFEPEIIHGKMDEIMKIFSRCINFYGGFVDKYMGDGIMALFGAKKATEQDTQRSILAAIKMQEQLTLYNKLLAREPGFENLELGLRIGINTGLVSVGKVGQSREGDFTVYGPEVNLASRMESNAPVNRIMLPKSAMQLVDDIFDFESYGPVSVKGMDEPIDCWLVIGQKTEARLTPKSVFIGREKEMQSLIETYQKAKSSSQILGLKGDAGIGKSRLIQEFSAHAENALILQGACSSISPSPFNLFSKIFENHFQIRHNSEARQKKERLDEALKALAEESSNPDEILDSLPLIGLLMQIRYPDPRVEQKGKDLLNHLMRAVEIVFLSIIAKANKAGQGIILILDDIHLVDEASAQALDFLLAKFAIQNTGILILPMYRLDYKILGCITDHPAFQELELIALDQEDIDELLSHYAADMNLSEEIQKKVSKLSHGNPFFLEEWCNYIGNLPKADLDEYPVPGNLHALILSRLDNLPQNLRMILHKASVIGQEFFVEILRQVEAKLSDPVNVEVTLADLEEHSLIMRMLGFDFSTYFFKHITTREVAYQTLLHQNRKMLHQLTAEAIEGLFAEQLDEFTFALAEHYQKAEMPQKAIPYLSLAVDKAARVYDNDLALKLGEKLLALLSDGSEKTALLIKLADIRWLTGNWEEAGALIEAAESICPEGSVQKCDIHRFMGVAAFFMGDFESALSEFSAGHALAESLGDQLQICISESNLGIWYQHHKHYIQALEHHHKSLALAESLKQTQRQAKTHSNLGLIHLESGDFDAAYEAFKTSLKLSEEHQFLRDESIALGNLGWACLNAKRFDEAGDWLMRKLDLARRMNDKLEIIKALGNLGNLHFDQEQYALALPYYEESLTLKKPLGNQQEIASSLEAIELTQARLEAQETK
ncbi:MAG: adenylate/guanylate cyclase domain-containing protein [Candidatus Cloacimonadaceae bacterium]|jgi:class 3 adenylate cyclase/Tfp pilus assembly protein PilF|nr:tetratricopeptide repeat protein [Candidatus Cloacimonadota bacterium]MDY0126622.1 adenylate/guanylate cyclase domain-containing protein [Candidatus Cloacimonadaceae bacterium]MCB5255236.1 tetratricopeptide repeat protein [Candidatus Cloacimonadota bacterium]MCK9177458.1 tetratricopeptide repeat protein [Candidatus Cloacimonadota bacterium]MCK9241942.1 tetratricopeptide repeat protein [Candidatus Cloacimonadota bacterium]